MNRTTIATILGGASKVPSPAKVVSVSDWYLLNHVSGKLIQFDHISNQFEGQLAETWEIDGNDYTFHLKSGLKFSDSHPLSAQDVANSIKFLIAQRTSTHFPIWEYFEGCEQLNSMDDACEGVEVIDEKTVRFRLKKKIQSFFLLLASPEGGIWKDEDLRRFTRNQQPESFSGPYRVAGIDKDKVVLQFNEQFLPSWFPERPSTINAYHGNEEQVRPFLRNGQIDIYFEAGRPFVHDDFALETTYASPSTILYLYRVGKEAALIDQNLMNSLWAEPLSDGLIPGDTFLPFTSRLGIDRSEYLRNLPSDSRDTTKKHLRIATLSPYFSDGLLAFLQERASAANYTIEFVKLNAKEWFAAFNNIQSNEYDFILSGYVASERYPSVQLRYLLEVHKVPFDLSILDVPDWADEQKRLLKTVENYILKNQVIIPMYFIKNQIRHRTEIDIGDQPMIDADFQLWRVKAKSQ